VQSVEKAAAVTKPVKKAVSLSIYLPKVFIELKADTGELVHRVRFIVGWKSVPSGGLWFHVVKGTVKEAIVRATELKEVSLIGQHRCRHFLADP